MKTVEVTPEKKNRAGDVVQRSVSVRACPPCADRLERELDDKQAAAALEREDRNLRRRQPHNRPAASERRAHLDEIAQRADRRGHTRVVELAHRLKAGW